MDAPKLDAARLEKLTKVIQNFSGRPAILSSHYDPDSISSAVMMERVLQHFEKPADLFFAGNPGRPQNHTVINLFELNRKLMPIEHFTERGRPEDPVILVDTPGVHDDRFGAKIPCQPTIIIDHHEKPKDSPEENGHNWFWFQNCGACASLIAMILFELKAVFANPIDDLATLGYIGISSDTKGGTSLGTTQLDCDMKAALRKFADQQRINEIFSSTLDRKGLDVFHAATNPNNYVISGNTLIAGLGEISPEHASYMAMVIDDLLIRIKGIATAYVWAIVPKKTTGRRLLINARNSDPAISLNDLLKRLFGDAGGAKYSNRYGVGGVDLDLGMWGESQKGDALLALVQDIIHAKLLL
jgi:nanoRNase/pAp phosphatase (c-di-AMP/oligoRNAs hydrolase)